MIAPLQQSTAWAMIRPASPEYKIDSNEPLIDTLHGKKDKVNFILLGDDLRRTWLPQYDPRNTQNNKALCYSLDGTVPTGGTNRQPGPCEFCSYAQWHGNSHPQCSEVHLLYCFDLENNMPFFFQVKRTGIKKLSPLKFLVEMVMVQGKIPIIQLSVSQEPYGNKTYHVPEFSAAGEVDEARQSFIVDNAALLVDLIRSSFVKSSTPQSQAKPSQSPPPQYSAQQSQPSQPQQNNAPPVQQSTTPPQSVTHGIEKQSEDNTPLVTPAEMERKLREDRRWYFNSFPYPKQIAGGRWGTTTSYTWQQLCERNPKIIHHEKQISAKQYLAGLRHIWRQSNGQMIKENEMVPCQAMLSLLWTKTHSELSPTLQNWNPPDITNPNWSSHPCRLPGFEELTWEELWINSRVMLKRLSNSLDEDVWRFAQTAISMLSKANDVDMGEPDF